MIGLPGPPSISAGYNPISMVTADLDGDGKPDLAVANQAGASVSVLFGRGNGTFTAAVEYPTVCTRRG